MKPPAKESPAPVGSSTFYVSETARETSQGEEATSTPHAENCLARDDLFDAALDQFVEHRAVDQRLEAAAHQHIRRGLAGLRIEGDAQAMVAVRRHLVVEGGAKAQRLVVTLAVDRQRDGEEGRIVDHDSAFFNRRGQPIDTLLVAVEDRCEELHQRFATNGRAMVEPSSIPGDAHVEIAADNRVRPAFIGFNRCG